MFTVYVLNEPLFQYFPDFTVHFSTKHTNNTRKVNIKDFPKT